jgi:sugar/nucleoside kinase (ribokinase family)
MPAPGTTSRVVEHLGDSSRPGGIAHTSIALQRSGIEVTPICAVGSDPRGDTYRAALVAQGCADHGIATIGSRSPSADLIYGPGGATACVFDAGGTWNQLTTAQRRAIADSDLLVLMIGPPGVTAEALTAADTGRIAWVVKADESSQDARQAHSIGQHADIVFHNREESAVVAAAVSGVTPTIVTTDGPRPIRVTRDGRTAEYPVPQLEIVGNPTGAGDALAGGFLGPWLLGESEETCVESGVESAARLLGGVQ